MTTFHEIQADAILKIAKDAAATEWCLKHAALNAHSAERDLDNLCHGLDSLAPPDVNPAGYEHHDLLTEARAALVQVRTLRRLVAQAYGHAAENALAAEREAAGVGQPSF